MSLQVRIYRLDEFIRVNKTGIVDVESSKLLIRELDMLCRVESIKNVLVDMRKTTISESLDFKDMIEVATEFANRMESCVRVANVIPDEERRIAIAAQIRDLIGVYGDKYQIFTTFEEAIDWFAKIEY
jgi:hypothetical protein